MSRKNHRPEAPEKIVTIDQLDLMTEARWRCLGADTMVDTLVTRAQETVLDERLMVLLYAVESKVKEALAAMEQVRRSMDGPARRRSPPPRPVTPP